MRSMALSWILCALLLVQQPHATWGIRKDIGLLRKKPCRSTVPGRYLLADDNVNLVYHVKDPRFEPQLGGYVCAAQSIDLESNCCPDTGEKFSCQGCNIVSECCNSYEYCVSCCLNPSRTAEEVALKIKIAKPITSGNYESVFDFCAGKCRHSSASVVHENAYVSDFHHCFSLPSNYSSGLSDKVSESRLNGINVIVGSRGENCDSVCKSKGQSCVPNKLSVLNKCEYLQRHMNCKSGCLSSMGADQPAEVFDDAPTDSNPGACLYTRQESMLSCEGLHQHTRRLCPCA